MNRKDAVHYLEDNGWPTGRELIARKHQHFLAWLKEETEFLDTTPKLSKTNMRLHCIEFDIYETPSCPECGETVQSFTTAEINDDRQYKVRFSNFCSVKCSMNSNQTTEKRKTTNEKRWGGDPSRNASVKQKRTNTMMDRYGVPHSSNMEGFHDKRKKTMQERYGADDWMLNTDNVDYVKSVWNEKYKNGHPSRDEIVRKKIEKTSLERYGATSFLTTDQFQKKRIETCMERYGEPTHMRVPEIKDKVLKANTDNHGGKLHTRLHMSDYAMSILNSKEELEKIYKEKKFMKLVADHIGCHFSSVQRAMEVLGIEASQSHKSSMGELEIAEFVKSLGFEIIQSDRTILTPFESDIVVPEKTLIIEYNGVYWHSEQFKTKNHHQSKSLMAHQKGYDLIHVYEDDWNDDSQRLKIQNKIRSKLGISLEKVYARKTTLRTPTKAEVRTLMDVHHIQGFVGYSLAYGLYEDDELVACLTLRKTSKEGVYDLNRYATSKTVVGGMSKLISHVKKTLWFEEIYTYAHLDYSSGGVYEKSGFTRQHITPPGLWYFKKGTDVRERREKYMKHKLPKLFEGVDLTKTEREIMEENGYWRIYDAGSIKYSMKNQ